jgi:hypothetical protein
LASTLSRELRDVDMWRVHGVWLLSCGYWHACEQPFLCFKVRHLWDAYRRRKPFALGNISGRRNGVSINRLYARKQGSFNRLSVGLGWNLKSNRRHAGLVPTLDIGTSFAISKLRFESLWEYFHFGTGRSMLGDLSLLRELLFSVNTPQITLAINSSGFCGHGCLRLKFFACSLSSSCFPVSDVS